MAGWSRSTRWTAHFVAYRALCSDSEITLSAGIVGVSSWLLGRWKSEVDVLPVCRPLLALIAEDPAIGCALYKCITCSKVREMDLPKRIVMFGVKDVR